MSTIGRRLTGSNVRIVPLLLLCGCTTISIKVPEQDIHVRYTQILENKDIQYVRNIDGSVSIKWVSDASPSAEIAAQMIEMYKLGAMASGIPH